VHVCACCVYKYYSLSLRRATIGLLWQEEEEEEEAVDGGEDDDDRKGILL